MQKYEELDASSAPYLPPSSEILVLDDEALAQVAGAKNEGPGATWAFTGPGANW